LTLRHPIPRGLVSLPVPRCLSPQFEFGHCIEGRTAKRNDAASQRRQPDTHRLSPAPNFLSSPSRASKPRLVGEGQTPPHHHHRQRISGYLKSHASPSTPSDTASRPARQPCRRATSRTRQRPAPRPGDIAPSHGGANQTTSLSSHRTTDDCPFPAYRRRHFDFCWLAFLSFFFFSNGRGTNILAPAQTRPVPVVSS
jgi:hypothetical protein